MVIGRGMRWENGHNREETGDGVIMGMGGGSYLRVRSPFEVDG